jgi:hypothetical protein
VYANGLTNRTIRNRYFFPSFVWLLPRLIRYQRSHGLRILYVATGTIGAFDFQSLLLNLVSALGIPFAVLR